MLTTSRIRSILSKLLHYALDFVFGIPWFFVEGYKGFTGAARKDIDKYRQERNERILEQNDKISRSVNTKSRAIVYFILLPALLSLLVIYLPAMSIAWIVGNFSTTDIVIVFAAMIYGLGYASYKPELKEMAYRFVAKAFFHEPLVDAEFLLDKRPQDVYTELSYIEKIGYFIIPLMIVFFIISEIATYSINTWNQFLAPFFGNISLEKLRTITTILIMFDLPLAAFFVFIFSTSFRFYFAQLSFRVAKLYEKRYDKMKYYMDGLKNYNKFLARNVGFQLDNLKIYSKIISNGIDEDKVISAFDYNNELKPTKYFMDFTADDKLLLEVKTVEKIKDAVIFIVTVLPLVILILGILFPSLKETLG